MKLSNVLEGISYQLLCGSIDVEIKDICYDSRKVDKNSSFICLVGEERDGHDYIDMALERGASVIFTERDIYKDNVTIIKLDNTRKDLARLSINFFDNPISGFTNSIAITGTKGKTTTAFMIKNILDVAQVDVGVIGTMGVFYHDVHYELVNTTPESYEIHKYLREMLDNGVKYVVMEVSSQALKTFRVDGMVFDYGIFTNLERDHVGRGEHASMEEYIYCKTQLFKMCKHGIFNIDDNYYENMVKEATCDIHTFGYKNGANLKIIDTKLFRDRDSIGIEVDTKGIIEDKIYVGIPGVFSSYNAMGAVLTTYLMGIDLDSIKNGVRTVKVRGRVEVIPLNTNYTVIVDYAHNGMALENILKTMREYNPKRIVSLFGCGGNRSRDRRYDMGYISGRYADFTIITEDNSRYEKVDDIMNDIEEGIKKTDGKYIKIPSRTQAIRYAIDNAREGDIILILGKGHETYQEVNGKRIYFDDKEEILKLFK